MNNIFGQSTYIIAELHLIKYTTKKLLGQEESTKVAELLNSPEKPLDPKLER